MVILDPNQIPVGKSIKLARLDDTSRLIPVMPVIKPNIKVNIYKRKTPNIKAPIQRIISILIFPYKIIAPWSLIFDAKLIEIKSKKNYN